MLLLRFEVMLSGLLHVCFLWRKTLSQPTISPGRDFSSTSDSATPCLAAVTAETLGSRVCTEGDVHTTQGTPFPALWTHPRLACSGDLVILLGPWKNEVCSVEGA